MSTIHLFVYGTLKRGECNHHLMGDCPFVQTAVTKPAYRLYDCGRYPALVPAANGLAVEGEVYLVDDETLKWLDKLEDAPRLYQLRAVDLVSPSHSVYTYLYVQSVQWFTDSGTSWSKPHLPPMMSGRND